MNRVELTGRLARDPEIKYSQGNEPMAIGRFTLAVDRRRKAEGQPTADFISCVAFGKQAEFLEKYFTKGMKAEVCGHIQTGSYTKQDGSKAYTTDVMVDELNFAESKGSTEPKQEEAPTDGFMDVGDGITEELPFV